MGQHYGVVIDVYDSGVRCEVLDNLVHVTGCGKPAADVDELSNTGLAALYADDAELESPLVPRVRDDAGHGLVSGRADFDRFIAQVTGSRPGAPTPSAASPRSSTPRLMC